MLQIFRCPKKWWGESGVPHIACQDGGLQIVWYWGKWPQVSGWADKKWPRSREEMSPCSDKKCPRTTRQEDRQWIFAPPDVQLSVDHHRVTFCIFVSFYVCIFIFLYFVFWIFKRKSLLDQMWSCLWISTVSLQLTRSLSHHPCLTKPAQHNMFQSYINFHGNIEDDEMLLKATMLMANGGGRPQPREPDNGW